MKDLCKQFFLFLCEFHRTCFLLRKRKQIFYETLPIGARCNAVEFLENLRVGLGVWHPAFSGNLFNRSFPFQKVLQRFPDSHIGQIFDKGKSGIAGEQSGGIAGAERKRFCNVCKVNILLIMAVDKLDCPHVVLVVSGVHRKLFKKVCCAAFFAMQRIFIIISLRANRSDSICGISIEKNHKKPTDFFFQGA